MMFVMLMGYFPYKGNSDEQLYRKINRADYPTQDINMYRKAHHLIIKMFTIDTDQRISAAQVHFLFMQILNHPWITESNLEDTDYFRKKNNGSVEFKKMLNLSK